jgi:hypothetical protein
MYSARIGFLFGAGSQSCATRRGACIREATICGLNNVARQVLCSVNTIRLIVFEDRSYKCVGGRIILYIDNER